MGRALVLAPFSADQLQRLRLHLQVDYESWLETRRIYDPRELASRLTSHRVCVLVVESDFVFEEVLQGAESLRFVGVCRGSTGHVDIDAATRLGVAVVNTPSRNARAAAEHTLGLMLALARGIPSAHEYVTQGRWENPAEPYITMRGVELAERTLGIIGLGAIGTELAGIGLALGMKVVAYDPYVRRSSLDVTLVSLEELMANADFVTVHVPGTADTEGMVDGRLLALMKGSAYLINTSDASVVDQVALVEALRDRRIGGAACDVFETHPIVPDNPLLGLDNVVLTPHLAGATIETIGRHSKMMADDILRFIDGRRPRNLVNPEVWDRRG